MTDRAQEIDTIEIFKPERKKRHRRNRTAEQGLGSKKISTFELPKIKTRHQPGEETAQDIIDYLAFGESTHSKGYREDNPCKRQF